MSVSGREPKEETPRRPVRGKDRMSVRSRNLNILAFAVTVCVMVAVFGAITRESSLEYVRTYAESSAEALGAHIDKEIGLMSKAAHSKAVADWMSDESGETKKALAYEELSGIIGELYSFNLYVGVEESGNEYSVGTGTAGEIRFVAALDGTNPEDAWYFECAESEDEYILSVNIDHVMQRKRVWLDYKVVRDGVTLGVICTGLEFSHVAEELFSHDGDLDMRSLIVDEKGIIHMDSSLMTDRDFLYGEVETPLGDEFSDPAFLNAVDSYLSGGGEGSRNGGETVSFKLTGDRYRRATAVPIKNTGWSVIVFSDNASWLSAPLFIPVSSAALALLAVFILVTNMINYRLIFRPLEKLDRSLKSMRESGGGSDVYGTGRDDELGHLSKTVRDLFSEANRDELTGIYNRRFMETNLEQIMRFLSRSGGTLSVFMLDIDYFKKYNDTYGHTEGDKCLKAVAQSFAGAVQRIGDFAARYGGEEFVVVLPNTDEDGARVIAERLLEGVRSLGIPHANNDAAPYVTVSAGVSTGKVRSGQTWIDFVRRADEALYASKQSGRNRYTHFSLE